MHVQEPEHSYDLQLVLQALAPESIFYELQALSEH
jgi:hypothetical protein